MGLQPSITGSQTYKLADYGVIRVLYSYSVLMQAYTAYLCDKVLHILTVIKLTIWCVCVN